MKNTVPIVIYNKDGSRTIIGSAVVEVVDDVAHISGSIAEEYKHIVQHDVDAWSFSFTPIPAPEQKAPEQ